MVKKPSSGKTSPLNYSQNYGKLASGLTEYAQYRAAVNAYEKMTKEEKLLFLEPYEGAYDDVEWNSVKSSLGRFQTGKIKRTI